MNPVSSTNRTESLGHGACSTASKIQEVDLIKIFDAIGQPETIFFVCVCLQRFWNDMRWFLALFLPMTSNSVLADGLLTLEENITSQFSAAFWLKSSSCGNDILTFLGKLQRSSVMEAIDAAARPVTYFNVCSPIEQTVSVFLQSRHGLWNQLLHRGFIIEHTWLNILYICFKYYTESCESKHIKKLDSSYSISHSYELLDRSVRLKYFNISVCLLLCRYWCW